MAYDEVGSPRSVEESTDKIIDIINGLRKEIQRFDSRKSSDAAGVKIRIGLQRIKKLANQTRDDIMIRRHVRRELRKRLRREQGIIRPKCGWYK